jgi:hypothetical protein
MKHFKNGALSELQQIEAGTVLKLNEERRNAEMAQERKELAEVKAQLLSQKAETVQEPVAEPQSEQVEGDDATGAEAAK